MRDNRLTGCGTALVTPFDSDGRVDELSLRALVEWQLQQGVHFVVPCGSTGEAATLTVAEHRTVVEVTVDQVAGRVPVVAGAGSNDTSRAIQLSRDVVAAGATHLLHVTPMYNRPPQRALLTHFRAIADAVDVPIVVYNVPGRTGVNLEAETCLTLADDARFAAVKEASGNLAQVTRILRERPEGFRVFSGDDPLTVPLMAHGADGVVSVVSNVVPHAMSQLCHAMAEGRLDDARQVDADLAPIVAAAFLESNPIPVKAMLALMGRIREVLRLPLVPLDDALRPRVRTVLEQAGLLPA
jgi:4-hydroxy-tetrahydrodipicolinate synthase